MTPGTVQPAL